MNSKSIDYSLLVLLALLWGSSFTMIKVALEDFHPAWIVQTRLVVGGIILLISCIVLKKNFPTEPKKYLELLFQGCLQGAIPFLLISYSEQHIDSGLAGLLNTTPPMVVFIISVFILRTKPFDIYKLIGLLLGLTGVYTASSVQEGACSVFGSKFCVADLCLHTPSHPVLSKTPSNSKAIRYRLTYSRLGSRL